MQDDGRAKVDEQRFDMPLTLRWTIRQFLCASLLLIWPAIATAHPPYGLVADRFDNVYFSDLETVWRLAPDGSLNRFRPGVAATHVHELALAPDGTIEGDTNRYDAATGTFWSALWRRGPDGAEGWTMPWTRAPPGGMGLLQDASGNRYTTQWPSNEDRRTMLFRRSRAGKTDLLHGDARAAARFRQSTPASVGGMAWLADGTLVFADAGRLRRYRPGTAIALLHQGETRRNFRGLSPLPGGQGVLAADAGRREVISVRTDGAVEVLYRSPAEWVPNAALWARGRLLVLEANADPREYEDRVRLVAVRDGSAQEVARPVLGPSAAAAPAPVAERRFPVAATGGAAAAASAGGLLLWLRRRRGA
ncbi:MAG TPA: hypothetical protein VGB48_03585 [Allosphingosinicella sp.]